MIGGLCVSRVDQPQPRRTEAQLARKILLGVVAHVKARTRNSERPLPWSSKLDCGDANDLPLSAASAVSVTESLAASFKTALMGCAFRDPVVQRKPPSYLL